MRPASPSLDSAPATARRESPPRSALTGRHGSHQGRLETWAPTLLASALALVIVVFAPKGNDWAAHAFQLRVFESHGAQAWTNLWYSGQYTFWTYSVLVLPLASLVGFSAIGVVSVGCATAGVAVLLRRAFGARALGAIWLFAAIWPAYLLSSDYPFALGSAFAILALVLLQSTWAPQKEGSAGRGRWRPAAFFMLTLATVASSPLAFAGESLVVGALGLVALDVPGLHLAAPGGGDERALEQARRRADRRRTAWSWLAIGVAGLAEIIMWRAFPYNGMYPFWGQDYASVLAFSAGVAILAWRAPLLTAYSKRLLLVLVALYVLVCTFLFLVPTAVGSNIVRVQYVAPAVMVLLCSLCRWRPRSLCAVALIASTFWAIEPQSGPPLFETADTSAAATAPYWAPAVSYLRSHLPASQRVEAVDTVNHWPALFLAEAGIPLVRGWYRQDDFPLNAILYHHFSPGAYRAWLRRRGVGYVVVSTATPDFSAVRERAMLASGRAGLRLVMVSPTVDVYALPHPGSILTGPGVPQVLSAGSKSFLLSLPRAGRYQLNVHWSPYWSATGLCTTERPDGLTTLVVSRPGVHRLEFLPSFSKLASEVLRPRNTTCSGA